MMTEDAARKFAGGIKPRPDRATVVGLYGDLGAGKTTFVQAAAKAFGVEENVVSPTFVIEKIYKLPAGKIFTHLIHIDAYRLNGGAELRSIGWERLVRERGNIIMVEWADRVEDIMPKDSIKISLKHVDENKREISIT
jgi:tRNA threonylcarbamoyladenosine biosynthesis protein TsaE